jgi:hypothetical protein
VPRTAHVAHPGKLAGSFSGTVTVTRTRASWQTPSSSGTAVGDGGNVIPPDSDLAPAVWPGLLEAAASLGVVSGCEIGAGIRLIGARAEGRCQLVGMRRSAPIALALSLGGGGWLYGMGPYGRAGFDSGFAFGTTEILVGAYARYGRRIHSLAHADVPPDPDYDPGHCCTLGSSGPWIDVEQTELRVSFPLGIAWMLKDRPGYVSRLIVGIVPGFVAHAADRRAKCGDDCDPEVVITGYHEDLSLSAALRLELGKTD